MQQPDSPSSQQAPGTQHAEGRPLTQPGLGNFSVWSLGTEKPELWLTSEGKGLLIFPSGLVCRLG